MVDTKLGQRITLDDGRTGHVFYSRRAREGELDLVLSRTEDGFVVLVCLDRPVEGTTPLRKAVEDVRNSLADLTYLRDNLEDPESLVDLEKVWESAAQRLARLDELLK